MLTGRNGRCTLIACLAMGIDEIMRKIACITCLLLVMLGAIPSVGQEKLNTDRSEADIHLLKYIPFNLMVSEPMTEVELATIVPEVPLKHMRKQTLDHVMNCLKKGVAEGDLSENRIKLVLEVKEGQRYVVDDFGVVRDPAGKEYYMYPRDFYNLAGILRDYSIYRIE